MKNIKLYLTKFNKIINYWGGNMVKKFISYYKPYKKLFLLDMLTALIAAICDLIYPYMTKELINISIPNKNLRMIIVFAIVLIIIFLIKAL